MSTGDHLALGAVAALAALGLASRRRRGSQAKTPKGRDREADELMAHMIGEDVARSMPDYAYLFEEDAPATRKTTRRPSVTQAPKTTRKKATPKKVAPKKAKVTAKQQGMINAAAATAPVTVPWLALLVESFAESVVPSGNGAART